MPMSEPEEEYEQTLDRVIEADPRYAREAYMFIQAALDFFQRRHRGGRVREHLTGPELLKGIRELAILEYGPLARSVLNHWGLKRGEDVGEIVYNLIGVGLMAKTDEDSREDFDGVMAFDETMDQETSW
jgi:uncharacterized repeat protein (TIGR04138 family)